MNVGHSDKQTVAHFFLRTSTDWLFARSRASGQWSKVRLKGVVNDCPTVPDLDSSTNRYTKNKGHKNKDTQKKPKTNSKSEAAQHYRFRWRSCLLGTSGVTWSLLGPSDIRVSSRFKQNVRVPGPLECLLGWLVRSKELVSFLQLSPAFGVLVYTNGFKMHNDIPRNTDYNNHRNKADRQTKTIRVLDLTSNRA